MFDLSMNIRKVILLAENQKGAFGNILGKTCAYACIWFPRLKSSGKYQKYTTLGHSLNVNGPEKVESAFFF
jgi:hypothetical protein